MRLALESDPSINLVRSYESGSVTIGSQQITRPFVLSPRELVLEWGARSIEELSQEDLEPLFARNATIVLLGAASAAPWPSATVRKLFRAKGIALECMDLGAACRTYNILATEERAVIAGLFP